MGRRSLPKKLETACLNCLKRCIAGHSNSQVITQTRVCERGLHDIGKSLSTLYVRSKPPNDTIRATSAANSSISMRMNYTMDRRGAKHSVVPTLRTSGGNDCGMKHRPRGRYICNGYGKRYRAALSIVCASYGLQRIIVSLTVATVFRLTIQHPPCFAAVSVAIGNTHRVEVKRNWHESAILYAIAVVPGDCKSHR